MGVAIAAAPLAPVNLSARVDRGTVVLNWQLLAHSPMATSYHFEVSLTPGGSAVATFDVGGDQTTLTVRNAPRGTYHVRVRARNAVGPSPSS
jgi:hypothetical protein